MRKKIITAVAVAGLSVVSLAGAAEAKKPAVPGGGGACVQEGLEVLRTVASIPAAAKGIDYSPFGQEDGNGAIRLALPEPSVLSLGTVVSLHATNPGLFSWCDDVS
jgi:hypothetical protein